MDCYSFLQAGSAMQFIFTELQTVYDGVLHLYSDFPTNFFFKGWFGKCVILIYPPMWFTFVCFSGPIFLFPGCYSNPGIQFVLSNILVSPGSRSWGLFFLFSGLFWHLLVLGPDVFFPQSQVLF